MCIRAVQPLNGIYGFHLGRPGLSRAHLFCVSDSSTAHSKRRPETFVILHVEQIRRQSSGGKKFSEPQPPSSSSTLLLRALRQSLSLRPLLGAFRGQSLRRLFRQSPEELVIALALYVGSICRRMRLKL
jgi:hypothetical protein